MITLIIIIQITSSTLGPLSADWVLVALGALATFFLKRNLDRIDKMLDSHGKMINDITTDVEVMKAQPKVESEKIAQEIITNLKFLSVGQTDSERKHYKKY